MRVVTWNINHPGPRRIEKIAYALESFSADVLVLTEFQAKALTLVSILKGLGYADFYPGSTDPEANSLLLAARIPLSPLRLESVPSGNQYRVVGARARGLDIVGMYFPQKEKKIPLFAWLVQMTPTFQTSPTLVIGDINTGRHWIDETGESFIAASEFEKLEHLGWKDLWRQRHGDARDYSWYYRPNQGFRLDHAFATPPLASRLVNANYSHACREQRLSDHSALVIDFQDVVDEIERVAS